MTIPRHRDRSQKDGIGYVEGYYTPSGNPLKNGPYVVSRHLEVMDDVVTPNFREVLARGGIVNNPCLYKLDTITSKGSSQGSHWSGSSGWEITHGYVTANYAPSDPVTKWPETDWVEPVVATEAEAKLKALAKVDSTSYSFGEDLGELRETIQFLRHPADSLLGLTRSHQKLLHKIRRRRASNFVKRQVPVRTLGDAYRAGKRLGTYKGEARNLAKAYADVWASYSFAAAPLVRSLSDGTEAFYTLPDRITVLGRESSHYRSEDVWSEEWTGLFYVHSSVVKRYFDVSRSWKRSVHAQILYEVVNPIREMADELGLRSKDFPVTMWQLMPLSFMVDRLYDVSSFMKAAINLGDPRVNILTGSFTRKTEKVTEITLTGVDNPSYPGTTTGETRTTTSVEYERTPWQPTFTDSIPKFNLGGVVDGASKIADTLAIVTKKLL